MIRKLDHYNIVTACLDETVRFYTEVLGLTNGPMMGSQKYGAWLYDTTDRPVVHLVGIDPEETPAPGRAVTGSGAIDHVAFECSGYAELRAKIVALGLAFRESRVTRIDLKQIFVKDPNGVTLELNFR